MTTLLRSITLLAIVAAAVACTSLPPGSGGSASAEPTAQGSFPADVPLGSWTSTLTEADLRAAGITDPGLITENTGTMTFTLAPDGTWTHSLETSRAVRFAVFRGTYTVTGADAFVMRTTFPPDYVGEVVNMEWRIKDGGLHLRAVDPPDPIIHVQMETHPWQPKG